MLSSFVAGGALSVLALSATGVVKPFSIPVVPYEVFSEANIPVKATPQGNTLRVVKTNKMVETTKDPIWDVELVVDGKVVDKVEALIGRSYRQTADRHIAGNKSPLPVGTYSIDKQGIAKAPFDDPELGKGYWVPITPLFSTGRSALGIHQDPSWGLLNKESGTSGCIGLRSPEDTRKVVEWVRQYDVRVVSVQS